MRVFSTIATLVLVGLAPGGGALGQASATLAGSVTDDSGRPLHGAHVYVAGTMLGTVTRPDGKYRLERLPLGNHRVVASIVGFEVQTFEITVREAGVQELDYVLAPVVYSLGEVEVSAREQRRWLRRLERFERTLFGTSSLADSVRLLNPEVLDFSSRFGKLTAVARAPLEIENRALGYRIRYDLTVFEALPHHVRYDGEPLFEELTPRDGREADRWAANRERAYRGSLRHLLRAMIADIVAEEGFRIMHDQHAGPAARRAFTPAAGITFPRPVEARRLIAPTEHENDYRLAFRGLLEVTYHRAPEDERFPFWDWNVDRHAHPRPFQRSEIYLTAGPTVVDRRGETADAFAITRRGYFAFRRLAMLLPVEYGLDPDP